MHENKISYQSFRAEKLAAYPRINPRLQSSSFRGKRVTSVINEERNPIPGVNVWLGFQERTNPGKDVAVCGMTNDEGLFTGQGGCSSVMGSDIRKEGYYLGWVRLDPFRDHDNILNRWLPWNPTVTTILRPIGNPIAMYAKSAWIEIPVIGQPCGYDLTRGDWITPYGVGKTPDLIFKLNRRYVSIHDLDMDIEIGFNNNSDGIQETQLPAVGRDSTYKWLRKAPLDGYATSLISRLSLIPNEKNRISANKKQMYFFRIRSETHNGKLVSALYGKIQGGFSLSPLDTKTCKVQMTYYLNPTPMDRNMEWKVGDNLLSLRRDRHGNSDEEPRDP